MLKPELPAAVAADLPALPPLPPPPWYVVPDVNWSLRMARSRDGKKWRFIIYTEGVRGEGYMFHLLEFDQSSMMSMRPRSPEHFLSRMDDILEGLA